MALNTQPLTVEAALPRTGLLGSSMAQVSPPALSVQAPPGGPTTQSGLARSALTARAGGSGPGTQWTAESMSSGNGLAADIGSLYAGLLGRPADQAGLDYWANSGMSLPDIENSIKDSREYGVVSLYRDVLGRDPDKEGLDYWLAGGMPLEDIAAAMRQSDEYQSMSGQGETQNQSGADARYIVRNGEIYRVGQRGDLVKMDSASTHQLLGGSAADGAYSEDGTMIRDLGSLTISDDHRPRYKVENGKLYMAANIPGSPWEEQPDLLYQNFAGGREDGYYLNDKGGYAKVDYWMGDTSFNGKTDVARAREEAAAAAEAAKQPFDRAGMSITDIAIRERAAKDPQYAATLAARDLLPSGGSTSTGEPGGSDSTGPSGGGVSSGSQSSAGGAAASGAQGTQGTGGNVGQGFQPSLIQNNPEDSVESILQRMLDSDSPLMQQAYERGKRYANSRGLLNSSVAAQSAQEAMIKEATPLAIRESERTLQIQMANQEAENAFGLQRDQQSWQSGENALGREHDITLQNNQFGHDRWMQQDQQSWQSGENALGREHDLTLQGNEFAENRWLQQDQQSWQSGESALGREHDVALQESDQAWRASESALERTHDVALQNSDQAWRSGESKLERDHAMALQKDNQSWLTGENAEDRQNRIDTANISANASIASSSISAGATVASAKIRAQNALDLAEIEREFAIEDREDKQEHDLALVDRSDARADEIWQRDRDVALEDREWAEGYDRTTQLNDALATLNRDQSAEIQVINSDPNTTPDVKRSLVADVEARYAALREATRQRYA